MTGPAGPYPHPISGNAPRERATIFPVWNAKEKGQKRQQAIFFMADTRAQQAFYLPADEWICSGVDTNNRQLRLLFCQTLSGRTIASSEDLAVCTVLYYSAWIGHMVNAAGTSPTPTENGAHLIAKLNRSRKRKQCGKRWDGGDHWPQQGWL